MNKIIRLALSLFLGFSIFQGCVSVTGVARYQPQFSSGAKEGNLIEGEEVKPGRFSPSKESPSSSSDPLMAFVNAWQGVPYRYGGLTRDGIDCSGFTSTLYRDVYKTDLPRTSRDQFTVGDPVPEGNLKPGDLVFFQLKRTRAISHVGVYIGDGKFAHASLSAGVTIDNLDDPYYKESYKGAKRLK